MFKKLAERRAAGMMSPADLKDLMSVDMEVFLDAWSQIKSASDQPSLQMGIDLMSTSIISFTALINAAREKGIIQ